MGWLGYHGVFSCGVAILWVFSYFMWWEIYRCWVMDVIDIGSFLTWVELGNGVVINMGYNCDLIGCLVMVIMGCGSLIVVSVVYVEMWDDKEGGNFMILLLLFLVMMGVMVSSSNLVVFYLGWEGIGLVSLFLINYWSERVRSVKAAVKVFCINKVGDACILFGICIIIGKVGTSELGELEGLVSILCHLEVVIGSYSVGLIHMLGIIFVIGGGVKSAQFGFHIWLLEAMEAPLGASALMHSSTLVIAGIVLVYKMYFIVGMSWIALWYMSVWGSWTAVFAAFCACWQFELKIVLAYSTISSMGFMYLMLGLGAISEVLLYLIIHAFIKIFLFLVVGLIMWQCNGMQDVRWMGGLINYMCFYYICYCWGVIGLVGLPYWTGYMGKSVMWVYVMSGHINNTGIVGCLLGANIFMIISMYRLGGIIFGGCRGGHRIIYKIVWLSWGIITLMSILMWLMAYWGICWARIIEGSYSNIYMMGMNNRNIINIYLTSNLEHSWYMLSWVYLIILLVVFHKYISSGLSTTKNLHSYWISVKWCYLALWLLIGLYANYWNRRCIRINLNVYF